MERYQPLHEDEEEGVRIECCEQIINVCVFDDEITDKQDAKMRELLLRLQEEDTYCLAVLLLMLLGVLPRLLILDKGMRRRLRGNTSRFITSFYVYVIGIYFLYRHHG